MSKPRYFLNDPDEAPESGPEDWQGDDGPDISTAEEQGNTGENY